MAALLSDSSAKSRSTVLDVSSVVGAVPGVSSSMTSNCGFAMPVILNHRLGVSHGETVIRLILGFTLVLLKSSIKGGQCFYCVNCLCERG